MLSNLKMHNLYTTHFYEPQNKSQIVLKAVLFQ